MNIFDIFKFLFNKKDLLEEEIDKYYDIYMINYLFSFHSEYVEIANLINKYTYKDKKQNYLFYYYGIESGKYPFANIKKEKRIEIDEDDMKLAKLYLPEMSIEKIKENWMIIGEKIKNEKYIVK